MKYLMCLLFVILTTSKNEFVTVVEYSERIERVSSNVLNHRYKLYVKANETFYEQIFEPQRTLEETTENEKGMTIIRKERLIKENMKYTYRNNDNIIFKDIMAFRTFVVKEDKINFDWKRSEETKKINDYNCKKATTLFRGRNYTAWYTGDIVTSAGPWKFYGLPGLILEIYDQDKILHIQANKIVFNSNYDLLEKAVEIKNEKK